MDQQTILIMQELSQQIKSNSPALAQIAQFMPVIEMNALTQICSNNQLSEEVRNIATARLEEVIKLAYGTKYANDNAKQFK